MNIGQNKINLSKSLTMRFVSQNIANNGFTCLGFLGEFGRNTFSPDPHDYGLSAYL